MTHRCLASPGALAVVITVVSLAWVPAAGQAPSSAAKATAAAKTKGTAFRTPWGDPDLQGIWNISTITPLERPKELAGKQFFSEEEAAALEEKATRGQFVDRPLRTGDPGTYNQFWMDSGTRVVPTRRTSLIVDPPDGRIPPLTAEGQKKVAAMRRLPSDGPFDSWLDIDTGERCITDGLPVLPFAYNNNFHILQTPEHLRVGRCALT